MKRPIIWALLFLTAGILKGRYLGSDDIVLFVIFILAAVMACGLICRWLKYPPIFLCVILAIAGALGAANQMQAVIIPQEDAQFVGIVEDQRFTQAGWQRMIVASPETRLIAFAPPQYRVQIGQEVKLIGELFALEWPNNPGAYNEFMVQRAHDVHGRFFASSIETFDVHMNLARLTHLARNRLSDVYHAVLPYREARLIQSIVLGERPDSDDPVVDMYRQAGIYHIMVVSGMHLSILMLAISFMLESVLNKRQAGLIALAIMIGYVLLTGAGISTVRAITMAGVAVFGRLLYRDRDSIASVSFACIALLLFQPLYLFSIGFQLSFGTVFGLVILTEPTERLLAMCRMPKYGKLRSFVAYNITAYISTLPIFIYHFGFVSTYSIFVNLIIMSTATFLVIVGFLVGIIGLFSIPVASFLAGSIYYLLQFYEAVIRFFLALPGSVWLVGNWGLIVTLVALAIMLAFAYTFNGFGAEFAKRAKLLWLSAFILVAAIGFEMMDRRQFNVTTLDIESHVIRVNNQAIIIDGGGNNRLFGMNTGERTLMPYLDYRGVYRAEAAFVTSDSRDRITGLIELAIAGRVRVLYVLPGVDLESGLGLRLTVAAEQSGVELCRVEIGDVLEFEKLEIWVVGDEEVRVFYRGMEFKIGEIE